jgi:hypothetical protein
MGIVGEFKSLLTSQAMKPPGPYPGGFIVLGFFDPDAGTPGEGFFHRADDAGGAGGGILMEIFWFAVLSGTDTDGGFIGAVFQITEDSIFADGDIFHGNRIIEKSAEIKSRKIILENWGYSPSGSEKTQEIFVLLFTAFGFTVVGREHRWR